MKLIKIAIYCCILSALSADVVFADKKMSRKTERQFKSITALLEKADQELEDGDTEEATKLYGATIAAYQDFSSKYSDANTEIVKFRVAYCRNQLMSLLANKHAVTQKQKIAENKVEPLSIDLSEMLANNIELCRTGNYAEVESAMQKALEKNPENSMVHLLLSTAYIAQGKLDLAMKHLEKSIELDPSNRDAHYNLCQLLIRADNPDFKLAASHYKISVELGADSDLDLEEVLNL